MIKCCCSLQALLAEAKSFAGKAFYLLASQTVPGQLKRFQEFASSVSLWDPQQIAPAGLLPALPFFHFSI